MPFIILILGLLIFVAGFRNTFADLGTLLKGDFSGPGNFFYWIAAFLIIGSLGKIKFMQQSSKMLLVLLLVVMIISDKGFFQKVVDALDQQPGNDQASAAAEGLVASNTGKSGGGLFGGLINGITSLADKVTGGAASKITGEISKTVEQVAQIPGASEVIAAGTGGAF